MVVAIYKMDNCKILEREMKIKRILELIVIFVLLFILTGCSSISTKNSVKKYLKEKYPDEKFTISYYGKVTLKSVAGGGDEVPGNTWEVTSEDTGISFYVQDEYCFNSFTTEYELDDDYFDVYFSKIIKEINDDRIKIKDVHVNTIDDETGYGYLDSISGVDLDINDFVSKEELAEFAVSLQKKLMEDARLQKILPEYFWYNVYDGEEIICSINFRLSDNTSYIIEEINKKEKI